MASEQTIDMGASMETEEGLAIIDALNEVSDVLAMEGPRVRFAGDGPVRLGGVGRLRAVDAYTCPRGVFLFFQEPAGPHWAVVGETAAAAAAAVHEVEVREHVQRQFAARGLR
jgi:hypothetical protein